MRSTPSRVLLAVLVAGAITAGVITSRFIFFAVGLASLFLLATSLAGAFHPLTKALLGFRYRAVDVTLWGTPPPIPPGTELVLTHVNTLSAGLHIFFEATGKGSIHLKVAQPRNSDIRSGSVAIGSARYVQWEGRRLPRVAGTAAVSIALRPESVRESGR
jgi:hypothetical protein